MGIEIDLSGRVAFVTGGSRGLGRADALTLARAGADVVVADLLVESQLSEETDRYGALATVARQQGLVHTEETVREIEAMGRRALAVRCDVTDRDEVDAAVARTVAGARLGRHPRQQRGHARPRRAVRRAVARALGARPEGQPHRRVQLRAGGVAAHEGARLGPDREHGLGRRNARRLRPGELLDDQGGPARPDADARDGGRPARDHLQRDRPRRDRHRGLQHGERGDERADRRAARSLKRPGEPQEIANAIAFLCSDLASYITGIELNVSGGVELFVF